LAISRTDQSKNPDELSANYSSLLPLPNDPKVAGANVYGVGHNANLNDKIRFSTSASIDLFKYFNYNAQLSLEYGRAMNDVYSESRRTLKADKSSNVAETRNLLFENTQTYSPKFGEDHNFQFLLGQSAEKTEMSLTKVSSVASKTTLSETVNDGSGNSIGQSDYSASTLLSFFSRFNYSYKQKYMVGASLRADGSSKFGASNRWGIFPSVSAGWNFSKEKVFSQYKWLNSGKVRFSYGVSGTTWSNNYLALGVMDGGSLDNYNSLLEISYGGVSGYSPTWYDGFKNDNLTWVKSQMSDIGVDLSLFNSQIEFIFDAYQKLTKGLLLTTPLPTTSGYNEVYRNAADVLNQGLEFTLNLNQRLGRKLHWNMGLNFAYNKNRVVALPDGNADIIKTSSSGTDFGSVVRVGNPLNGFFFYQSQGIYQTENEIPVDPKTGAKLIGLKNKVLAVGDRNFKDQNNDYLINVNDRMYSGDPNPKWTGGWTNDFSYGNFGLNVVSTFTLGRKIVNSELLGRLSLSKNFAGQVSLPNFVKYSIWERSGDNAKYPSLNPWSDVNQIFTQDSEYIEDGSYFKIKSVTFSYNFDKKVLKRLPFTKARLYCTLDNAITFQKYSGPDAELVSVDGFDNSGGYPMRRMLLFGISLGL
jgi:TonB-linked SusC/RagA family outer membrane protein